MDAKLLAWARVVAAAQPAARPAAALAVHRRAQARRPASVVARLPKGFSGVVLRHDGVAGRAALGRDLARLCRARRLRLVVAGDPRLAAALGAGVHLRGGRWPAGAPVLARRRRGVLLTSSAHSQAELRRAARAGADLAFLSPAFATRSHPDAMALACCAGANWRAAPRWRWRRWAGSAAPRSAGCRAACAARSAPSKRLPRLVRVVRVLPLWEGDGEGFRGHKVSRRHSHQPIPPTKRTPNGIAPAPSSPPRQARGGGRLGGAGNWCKDFWHADAAWRACADQCPVLCRARGGSRLGGARNWCMDFWHAGAAWGACADWCPVLRQARGGSRLGGAGNWCMDFWQAGAARGACTDWCTGFGQAGGRAGSAAPGIGAWASGRPASRAGCAPTGARGFARRPVAAARRRRELVHGLLARRPRAPGVRQPVRGALPGGRWRRERRHPELVHGLLPGRRRRGQCRERALQQVGAEVARRHDVANDLGGDAVGWNGHDGKALLKSLVSK